MKATGIARKVDGLGRVVLPIELRRTLGIEEKDPVEIFVEGECILLKKYQPEESAEGKLKRFISAYGEEAVLKALEHLEEKNRLILAYESESFKK